MSAEAIANWWLASIIAEGVLACVFLGIAIWLFCTPGKPESDRTARKVADREN
jgi:hypothetical protein